MSKRLTNDARRKILSDAMHVLHESKGRELKKERNELGMLAYMATHGEALRELDALSDEAKEHVKWTRTVRLIEADRNPLFGDNYAHHRPQFFEGNTSTLDRRVAGDGTVLVTIPPNLRRKAKSLQKRWDEAKAASAADREAINKTLSNCTTLKQLQAAWPEGRKFYKFLEEGTPNLPIAVADLSDVNKRLKKAAA